MSWLSDMWPSLFAREPKSLVKPETGDFWRDLIQTAEERFTIPRLRLLAEGCRKHPAYRAIRQPRTHCSRCADMWGAANAMKRMSE